MKGRHSEQVGKVFVVTCGMRGCLICGGVFTPKEAAEHAAAPCCPLVKNRNKSA